MDIWALRRRQMRLRYGRWLLIFLLTGAAGAYIYDPGHPAGHVFAASIGNWVTPRAMTVKLDDAPPTQHSARQSTALAALFSAPSTWKPRTVAGVPESELRCLALAIYHDGAGEPLDVKRAMAQVAMNRVRVGKDSKALCKVVYFGLGMPHGCLFKAACRKVGAPHPEDTPGWTQAMDVATDAVSQHVLAPKLQEATHFHDVTLARPDWSRQLYKIAILGRFVFYSQTPVDEAADNTETPVDATGRDQASEASTPKPVHTRAVARHEPSTAAGHKPQSDLSSVFTRNF